MSLNGKQQRTDLNVAPVPTTVNVCQAVVNGVMLVRVDCITPTGIACYFLDGQSAKLIGEHLAKIGPPTALGLSVGGE